MACDTPFCGSTSIFPNHSMWLAFRKMQIVQAASCAAAFKLSMQVYGLPFGITKRFQTAVGNPVRTKLNSSTGPMLPKWRDAKRGISQVKFRLCIDLFFTGSVDRSHWHGWLWLLSLCQHGWQNVNVSVSSHAGRHLLRLHRACARGDRSGGELLRPLRMIVSCELGRQVVTESMLHSAMCKADFEANPALHMGFIASTGTHCDFSCHFTGVPAVRADSAGAAAGVQHGGVWHRLDPTRHRRRRRQPAGPRP